MEILIATLIGIVSVLLILIVLIQKPKGGGLGSSFGGGSSNMLGGVKQTNQFLDKGTWILASTLLVLVLITNVGVVGKVQDNTPEAVTEGDVQSDRAQNQQDQFNFNTNGQIQTDLNTEDQ